MCDAAPARAAEERIGIEYSAASGCPTPDEFITQVLERTDNAKLASGDERVRTFVVEITRSNADVSGSLVIREPDGTSSQARSFNGSHCSEVAMALALATALAIDPTASFAPRRDEPPPEEPPADPLVVPDYDGSTVIDPPDPIAPYRQGGSAGTDVMVGPAIHVGIGPAPAYGGVLLLEGRSALPALGSGGVQLLLATVPTEPVAGAAVSFDLALARPHACLFPIPTRGQLRLMSCLGVELGVVRARGSDLPLPAEQTLFWAAGTFGPRLLWDLSDRWSLDVDGSAVVPFKRYGFRFDNPETRVHAANPVVYSLALRVGAGF